MLSLFLQSFFILLKRRLQKQQLRIFCQTFLIGFKRFLKNQSLIILMRLRRIFGWNPYIQISPTTILRDKSFEIHFMNSIFLYSINSRNLIYFELFIYKFTGRVNAKFTSNPNHLKFSIEFTFLFTLNFIDDFFICWKFCCQNFNVECNKFVFIWILNVHGNIWIQNKFQFLSKFGNVQVFNKVKLDSYVANET